MEYFHPDFFSYGYVTLPLAFNYLRELFRSELTYLLDKNSLSDITEIQSRRFCFECV